MTTAKTKTMVMTMSVDGHDRGQGPDDVFMEASTKTMNSLGVLQYSYGIPIGALSESSGMPIGSL